MSIFECEICGNTELHNHKELVEHIINTHSPEYTESDAEYFSNLWEESKLQEQETEKLKWE